MWKQLDIYKKQGEKEDNKALNIFFKPYVKLIQNKIKVLHALYSDCIWDTMYFLHQSTRILSLALAPELTFLGGCRNSLRNRDAAAHVADMN